MIKKKLGEIATYINGYPFKPSDWSRSGMEIIRIQNLTGSSKESNYFNGEIKGKYIVRPGDILISWSATLGVFVWEKEKAVLNQHIFKVEFDKNKQIDKAYFVYAVSERLTELSRNTHGSTMKHITKSRFDNVEIPLPPLPTQQKIAAVLDKADAIRKRSQQILVKYDQLAQSVFLEMFGDPVKNEKGWESISLEKICGVGSSKRVFVDELVNKGIPFYRGTEVGKLGEGEKITPSLFITEKHYKDLRDYSGIPQIGDLLMPSICPDGRIWRVNDDRSFYFKDGRVLWIKVNPENINSIYLHAFLRNIFQQNYSNIASGTTFAELKIFALKKIEVLIPADNLQNKFATIIAQIEKQKAQTQLELNRAEELYQSLLQRAFTGELFPEPKQKELTVAP